jgi:hypothetical protein
MKHWDGGMTAQVISAKSVNLREFRTAEIPESLIHLDWA